jgi:hypothetical protein
MQNEVKKCTQTTTCLLGCDIFLSSNLVILISLEKNIEELSKYVVVRGTV